MKVEIADKNGTYAIRLEMFDSIQVIFLKNFTIYNPAIYVYAKGCTYTHIYIHTARDRGDDYGQNLQSRFA